MPSVPDLQKHFWELWTPLFRRLRPQQAERLLAATDLIWAMAWGQVDLTPLSLVEFPTPEVVPLEGDDSQVHRLDRSMRNLVRKLSLHPEALIRLIRRFKLLERLVDHELDSRALLMSSMAAPYPVKLTNIPSHLLLEGCEFREIDPEILKWSWLSPLAQVPRTVPVRCVTSRHERLVELQGQLVGMGQSPLDVLGLLHFCRQWRDLGDNELTLVAAGQRWRAGEELVMAVMYYAAGRTSLRAVPISELRWRDPNVRIPCSPLER